MCNKEGWRHWKRHARIAIVGALWATLGPVDNFPIPSAHGMTSPAAARFHAHG